MTVKSALQIVEREHEWTPSRSAKILGRSVTPSHLVVCELAAFRRTPVLDNIPMGTWRLRTIPLVEECCQAKRSRVVGIDQLRKAEESKVSRTFFS
jgi:hypothetical protein